MNIRTENLGAGAIRVASLCAISFVGGIVLISAVAFAESSSTQRAPLNRTIEGAQAVVHGRVQLKRSEFLQRPDGTRTIVTRYSLAIDETMKGSAPGDRELVVDGGTVGDLTLVVSDMPPLEIGEEVVVLGDHTPQGFRLHDRSDGLLRIERGSRRISGRSETIDDVARHVQTLEAK